MEILSLFKTRLKTTVTAVTAIATFTDTGKCSALRPRTFQEEYEVLLVVRPFRVLPVHVQAIEVAGPQERYSAVDERLPSVPRGRHIFELLRAERPSACEPKPTLITIAAHDDGST